MKKLSQTEFLASNPATAKSLGLNDMPMNNAAQANVSPNGTDDSQGGVSPDEMKKVLHEIVNSANPEDCMPKIEELASKPMSDGKWTDKLNILYHACKMANNPRQRSVDQETGKKDPTPKELALKYIKELEPLEKDMTASAQVYNFKLSQKLTQKKKKTRGNPFRVLMGKVGKLLDHGIEKQDIVRYISKLNYWNKETIERAVEIVQEYNRKKEHKKETKNTSKKEVVKDVVEEIKTHGNKTASKVSTAAYDYTVKPNFKTRSTGELIYRAGFLLDLQVIDKNTKQGDFKEVADKKGAKEELQQIKAALKDRGMGPEELEKLGLGK
jgi:hypothetical protein